VSTYGRGVWWAISLVTTVGFVGQPPETTAGAVLSVCLMVLGVLLLAMVGASLAALFVMEEERPREERRYRSRTPRSPPSIPSSGGSPSWSRQSDQAPR
jgi:hypothetical protein